MSLTNPPLNSSRLDTTLEMESYSTPVTQAERKGAGHAGSMIANTTNMQDNQGDFAATNSSAVDAENMRRLGKQPQLVRRFRLFSIASFITLSTVSWEYGVFTLGPGLTNGGRSGLIYSTLWSFIGFGPIYLSMAEMASMAPTAGAQYHWVSEFAPESCQRVLSYITGFVSRSPTVHPWLIGSMIAGVLR